MRWCFYLINVILYGSALDTSIRQAVFDDLARRFCISYHDGRMLARIGTGREIMLLDTDRLSSIKLDHCILLMKTDASPSELSLLSGSTVAVANSENGLQLAELSELQIPVLTCGMRPKDTLTYSSCGQDNVVIALQRTITTVDGSRVEPLELPIADTFGIDGYPLLAYTALRLLLGDEAGG